MKKLRQFNPSLITKTFFKHHKSPSDINEGECFIWAYLAHLIFKDVEIWYMNAHAFVRYRGKFYDSERPNGVAEWKYLPATKHGHTEARRRKVDTFKRYWATQPGRFETTWKEIESKAKELLRHGA